MDILRACFVQVVDIIGGCFLFFNHFPYSIELYLQDIVENKLPGTIISEPKINIEYGTMDSRVFCNIYLRGAYILSVQRFELIQLAERSVWRPRVNYNILPEDCLFQPEMVLRSG